MNDDTIRKIAVLEEILHRHLQSERAPEGLREVATELLHIRDRWHTHTLPKDEEMLWERLRSILYKREPQTECEPEREQER